MPVRHRLANTRPLLHSRPMLLVAFAFAVMGDPVSSVAYAIEAALRALHGDLGLLLVTMGLVLGIIVLVSLNYRQLYARFPEGGGDAAAIGKAFGERWAFLPLGSLIVDYALTITIDAIATNAIVISPKIVRPPCPNQVSAATATSSTSASGIRSRSSDGTYAMIAEAPAATLIAIVSA